MKLVKIEANTEALKKTILNGLKEVAKDIKDGNVETFFAVYMQNDGTVKTCQYSSLADRDAGILKRLGLLEIAKTYMIEDFNG